MQILKTATLITFLFMARFGFADILNPSAGKCTQLEIHDAAEVQKLSSMITGSPHTENIQDGDKTLKTTTKEMSLGKQTTLRCVEMTEDGQPVMRWRGMRSGCTIAQSGGEGKGGIGSKTGTSGGAANH
jgi:hypothetical protein